MSTVDPRSVKQLDKFWFDLAAAVALVETDHEKSVTITLGTRQAKVAYNRDTDTVMIGIAEVPATPPTLIAPPTD